jgi:crotonobetaine/carnitine-CoA ligase
MSQQEVSQQEDELTAELTAQGATVLDRMAYWSARTPDAVAVYDGERDRVHTYAGLQESTGTIAGNLRRLGIRKGSRVSVFTTDAMLATQTMLAIWRAGALYCPINFSYAGRLLSYQLADTRPDLIIVDAALAGTLDAVRGTTDHSAPVIVFADGDAASAARAQAAAAAPESGWDRIAWDELAKPARAPEVTVTDADPANIIYTSGTTGPAKGVLQPHRWINQYTYSMRQLIDDTDVIYNDLPMYHVGGAMCNVVRALWMGAEAAIWDKFSSSEFWSRINRRHATSAILLDVMIPWLMNAPAGPEDAANSLRKVHMQPLPLNHQQVAQRFGFDFVTAGFGQTESGASLAILIDEFAGDEPGGTPAEFVFGLDNAAARAAAQAAGQPIVGGAQADEKGLMGHPTRFVEAAVWDAEDHECAPGIAGQLVFKPLVDHLFLDEYIGRPEATASAWTHGWFHTGDAAVKRADGMFRFVDRMGDRMRVRGENLSSFQVEDMLNQHPQVQYSAVFAIPGEVGDEDDIVAYVVANPGSPVTAEDLTAYAEDTMPKFMRPRHIRIVDDIPRTPTNKIEKYKLKQRINDELGR